MKPFRFISSVLAISLTVGAPTVVFAHAGHGDEFQAQGGIQRVKVNAETDSLLGISVTPITQKSASGVMIPATALVDADGKKLVFVQYENFYEPVPVKTGATKGEQIEVTEGLSVGEKLVTQGSLSLFAESRKTQSTAASPSPAASPIVPKSEQEHAQAHAQGTAHSHDQPSGMPMKTAAGIGGGVILLGGVGAFLATRKKKSIFSDKGDL